ncbi:MAG: hypothetical protein OYH77_03305 [Pseudomonadota bacterium]|nr:hypothetical protein [Pseudomonadota bacterium]
MHVARTHIKNITLAIATSSLIAQRTLAYMLTTLATNPINRKGFVASAYAVALNHTFFCLKKYVPTLYVCVVIVFKIACRQGSKNLIYLASQYFHRTKFQGIIFYINAKSGDRLYADTQPQLMSSVVVRVGDN